MIVTCPGCSSKYRVRNESVPADGARMRCPKCETLFLAKPPADGSSTVDDPSSMYQQLLPQGARGNTGANPPVPPQAAPGIAQAPGAQVRPPGPVTALFAAVDSSQLPPEAQLPPAPLELGVGGAGSATAMGGGAPADGARMRTVSASASALREATAATAAMRRANAPPSRGAELGSWVALGAGAVGLVFGALTWAWTTEALPLDGALMPVARAVLSEPGPAATPLDVDAIRRSATQASERGDLPAAIVAWRRVKAASPDGDRRPSEALAKMLVELGEVP